MKTKFCINWTIGLIGVAITLILKTLYNGLIEITREPRKESKKKKVRYPRDLNIKKTFWYKLMQKGDE